MSERKRDNRLPVYICVDVETDGPAPGLCSMISLGAIAVGSSETEDRTFYVEMRPLVNAAWFEDALEVTGFTREQVLAFPDPMDQIGRFRDWIEEVCGDTYRPIFVSDNAGFDWQFVNYYLTLGTGGNPFGHTSISLTWMIKGFAKTDRTSMRDWRGDNPHTHNALDDCRGNVHALRKIVAKGMRLYGFPEVDPERSGSPERDAQNGAETSRTGEPGGEHGSGSERDSAAAKLSYPPGPGREEVYLVMEDDYRQFGATHEYRCRASFTRTIYLTLDEINDAIGNWTIPVGGTRYRLIDWSASFDELKMTLQGFTTTPHIRGMIDPFAGEYSETFGTVLDGLRERIADRERAGWTTESHEVDIVRELPRRPERSEVAP